MAFCLPLATLLGTGLTLPTCFFFVDVLGDPPCAPVILASSESTRKMDSGVVHEVLGSSWVICCTTTSASAWAASNLSVEGWAISLVPWEGTWPEHRVALTLDSTELAREGGTVFKVCMEPVQARRISHHQIFVHTSIGASYTYFISS